MGPFKQTKPNAFVSFYESSCLKIRKVKGVFWIYKKEPDLHEGTGQIEEFPTLANYRIEFYDEENCLARKMQGMSDQIVLNWKIKGYHLESEETVEDYIKEGEQIVGSRVGLNKWGKHPSTLQFLVARLPKK